MAAVNVDALNVLLVDWRLKADAADMEAKVEKRIVFQHALQMEAHLIRGFANGLAAVIEKEVMK